MTAVARSVIDLERIWIHLMTVMLWIMKEMEELLTCSLKTDIGGFSITETLLKNIQPLYLKLGSNI